MTDAAPSLQTFALRTDLAPFTSEKGFPPEAGDAFGLFLVGVDDVHGILKNILSRVRVSLVLSMFGYDDAELNDILMAKALDPAVTLLVTLDKSQAGGVAERKLLDADREHELAAFNTHFVIGQSATHQINHTKGFVADGRVAGEGSTNWSASGEGTFGDGQSAPGGAGYRAQNNSQTVFTDPYAVARFQARLISEHMIARGQEAQTVPPEQRQRKLPVAPAATPA